MLFTVRSFQTSKALRMAVLQPQTSNLEVHKLPQSKYVDAVRWLPPLSAFDKSIVLSLFDSDSDCFSVEIHALDSSPQSPDLSLSSLCSFPSPSRTTSLKTSQTRQKTLIAFSTTSGALHLLFPEYYSEGTSINSHLYLDDKSFHQGAISCIDVLENECISVGDEGRINLVNVGEAELLNRRIFDSSGLISYTAAKWASPQEFATGGPGFSLQWWDQRKPGSPALQFKGNGLQTTSLGIVHSIDIHPSRKHTCLAGGSAGTVFAWDLRWQQRPIILSGVGSGERAMQSPSESEVWEVQYDSRIQSSSISSSRMLPVMMCSEGGILAVIEQGMETIELLAEPCAINSFDIDKQNYSNVICGLEWESMAILSRS